MGKWYFVYTQDSYGGIFSTHDEDIRTELQPGTEEELLRQANDIWSHIEGKDSKHDPPRHPRVIYEILIK